MPTFGFKNNEMSFWSFCFLLMKECDSGPILVQKIEIKNQTQAELIKSTRELVC